ncbi:MAG: CtsR family transcriptional regulator [Negativicutes bacterium]|nr:CtsR family transcriptional regulator [Negativicutes bacterium]
MAHLADIIEEFILQKLLGERKQAAVLKRNELAEELQCAPSQISYVLSTRFTVQRGFIVESRRGSGGFVRIVRIPVQQIIYQDAAEQVMAEVRPEAVEDIIDHLHSHGLLSNREAELMIQFFRLTAERLGAEERARVLQSLLLRLADFS